MQTNNVKGLSTERAMDLLCEAIEKELNHYKMVLWSADNNWRYYFSCNFFLHSTYIKSVLHWPSLGLLLLFFIALLSVCLLQENTSMGLVIEMLSILLFLMITIIILIWDDWLRKREVLKKIQSLMTFIKECHSTLWWNTSHYLSLHTPIAPCISLQWVLRDGEIVNISTCLLVEGDIVLLRPGQISVAHCSDLEKSDVELKAGEVYCPDMVQTDSIGEARVLRPLRPRHFLLLETPIRQHLRYLLRNSCQRPESVIDNEMYLICSRLFEIRIVPIWLGIMLVINLIRLIMVDNSAPWYEMMLQLPVECILPISAIVFPLLWKLLDVYGNARLLRAFEAATKCNEDVITGSSCESSPSIEKVDEQTLQLTNFSWDILTNMLKIAKGSPTDYLYRTANPLHGFANVTDVCCVDKKGIISWPNPSVEKVFFMRNRPIQQHSTMKNAQPASFATVETVTPDIGLGKKDKKGMYTEHNFEVLGLSPDQKDGYRLQFDDVNWRKHMASLKPLGLDILLNTCNMNTTESYTQFADHITCASMAIEETVPVVNRRCFCELSAQIGFSEKATEVFQMNNVFGIYRSVSSDTVQLPYQGKTSGRYKMPLPNAFSVVLREGHTGSLHLFSQGTGDLLLDLCSDFWDGHDLCPLKEGDRKKISDFYHRTSLTSYCMAFAYRPITQMLSDDLDDFYIELPEDSTYLSSIVRYPSQSTLRVASEQNASTTLPHLSYHGSADSLITGTSLLSINEPDGFLRVQCNQVFVGLVTMQYQAMQDVVHMIEEFETCCIRFVHFSKENELRSRVFSEKMGLEAGWNCHISLLAEKSSIPVTSDSLPDAAATYSRSMSISRQSRIPSKQSTDSITIPTDIMYQSKVTRSLSPRRVNSAPANINLDVPIVKFDEVTEVMGAENYMLMKEYDMMSPQNDNFFLSDDCTGIGSNLCKAKTSDGVFAAEESCRDNRDETKPLLEESRPRNPERKIKRELTRYNEAMIDPLLECSDVPQINDSLDDISSTDSYPTSSHPTENTDSVTGGLGLSNRARLPRGIENIRPHIETVDNVPLLVSLFTDCTTETTQEMMKILQEYGEVILCVGSTLALNNISIFTQADVSIGLDPICPQVCMKCAAFHHPRGDKAVSPLEIASRLCSLPCSFRLRREYGLRILHQLITLSRLHTDNARNVAIFLLIFSLTLSLLQSATCVCLLPPVLASAHVIWLVVVVGPLLALSMMGTPLDPEHIKRAPEKNKDHVPRKSVVQFLICYLVSAVPTIAVCLLCHYFTLNNFCQYEPQTLANSSGNCQLFIFSASNVSQLWNNGTYSPMQSALTLSQNFVAVQFVFYLIVWSASYVHRIHHIWQRLPISNRFWTIAVLIIIVLQFLFACCHVTYYNHGQDLTATVNNIPMTSWLIGCCWPIGLFITNECIKWKTIKQSIRYQKRARLDFGTKLGMNSPF